MNFEIVQVRGAVVAPAQGANSAVIQDLARHKADLMLRESDVRVKLEQVREAKAAVMARLAIEIGGAFPHAHRGEVLRPQPRDLPLVLPEVRDAV